MSVTATISVSPTVVNQGQQVSCTATLTNSVSGTQVMVVRVTPYVTTSSGTPSYSAGRAVLPIGQSMLLGSSASALTSLSFQYGVNLFGPPAPLNPPYPSTPAYDTYTLGFVAELGDGTTATASTTVYVYPLILDSTLALTSMPGNGYLWFNQNTESALIGAFSFPL